MKNKECTQEEKVALSKRGSMRSEKRKDAIFIFCVLIIPILYWCLFTGYGNVMMFVRSFQRRKLSGEMLFTWDNYVQIFNVLIGKKDVGYWSLRTLWNSLSILPLVVIMGHPLSFLCAYYVYKKYPAFKLFRIILMLSTIISAVVWCQFWKLIWSNQLGVMNDLLRVLGFGDIIPFEGWFGNEDTAWPMLYVFSMWTNLGGSSMLYFSSAMGRIPVSLFESADLDGATEMKKLLKIVLPLMWPIYCTMTITSLGVVFSWYMPALLMTAGGPDGATATIGLIVISEAKENKDVGLVSAMGVYIFILGGLAITGIKKLMQKCYEEVEY